MKKQCNLVWNLSPENFNDGKIPEDFKGELDETIKSFIRYTSQLLDKIQKAGTTTPITYQEVATQLQKIKAELETNAPFFLEVFDQSLNRMIYKARQELNNASNRTGTITGRPERDTGEDTEEVSEETSTLLPTV